MNNLGHNTAAGKQLRAFVQRVEFVDKQISDLNVDRSEIFAEAKGLGFCTKTMRTIIKLRKMTDNERREAEALLDLYKGAMGMLDGTPLGEYARQRLNQRLEADTPPADDGEPSGDATDRPQESSETPPDEPVDAAREKGRQAARDGQTVIENPYAAGKPHRAAWDEGWCEEQGSDGMGIPAAWRRSKPRKDGEDETQHGDGGEE